MSMTKYMQTYGKKQTYALIQLGLKAQKQFNFKLLAKILKAAFKKKKRKASFFPQQLMTVQIRFVPFLKESASSAVNCRIK